MSSPKVLKIVFVIGIVATLAALVLAPKVEGYGDFVARVFLVSLGALSLTYSAYAIKKGEVEVKGFTSKRSDSPALFWFGICVYLFLGCSMLGISLMQIYT
ncbi:hypothetical protein [Thalassotalea litorea]|uniref:hypothetical protein n=1 Tax=Thalassotalea litorea TaxID=2020715 RepID=UPI003735E930